MREKRKSRERPQGAMLLLNSSSSSSSSSSIPREPPPEAYHSTAIGCMSGIFRLFSKHQHSNRRLTFGITKEESGRSGYKTDILELEDRSGSDEVVDRRVVVTTNSPRIPTTTTSSSAAAAEKRMYLLGALAKCDEDLRELRKIIEELKSDSLAVERNADDDADDVTNARKEKNALITNELSSCEQPSPVSVLDEVTRSPPFSCCATRSGSLQYGNFQQQQRIKKMNKEEFLGSLHLINIQQVAQHGSNLRNSPLWCSRAIVETVEKACSEMAWGEKREQGRIGMALQEQIYRDLINETVKEVMEIGNMHYAQHLKLYYINGKLHRRGCRRRLSY